MDVNPKKFGISGLKVMYIRLLAVLILFSLSRLIFYFSNLSFWGNVSFNELLLIFKGGIRFDVVSVIYLNLIYILIYLTPGKFKNTPKFEKITNIIFITTNLLGLILNTIDNVYFQFNLRRTNWFTISELNKLNNGGELFMSFFVRYWYDWVLWIFFGICLYLFTKYIRPKKYLTTHSTQFDWSFLSIFFLLAGLRGGDLNHATRPLGLNNAGEYTSKSNLVPIVLNTPFTIFQTFSNTKLPKLAYFKSEQELDAIYNPIQHPNANNKPFNKLNVVIFIIESYSEEASGLLNKSDKTGGFTPFLDSLRLNSLYSLNSFSNGKKSIEALPSVLCGVPSLENSFVLSAYSGDKLNSLPEILSEKGYETAFFHGAPNGSMGFQAFTNLIGFKNYIGKNEYNNNDDYDGIWGIWDEPFLQFSVKKISEFKKPFFSTIFTLSSHDPFKVPQKYANKFKKGPFPIYQTLSYTDYSIRKFFEIAQKQDWYQNTLFVFTADHTSSHATEPTFSNNLGRFRIPIFFFKPTAR